jgi:hypothetical protein
MGISVDLTQGLPAVAAFSGRGVVGLLVTRPRQALPAWLGRLGRHEADFIGAVLEAHAANEQRVRLAPCVLAPVGTCKVRLAGPCRGQDYCLFTGEWDGASVPCLPTGFFSFLTMLVATSATI